MSRQRALAWFAQAEKDYLWGTDSLKAGHFAQTCFIAQQVAEKALKALAFGRSYDLVKSHSLVRIASDLKINGDLEGYAKKLDLYYLSARYPDALPDHTIPSLSFDQTQAAEALKMAHQFLKKIKSELKV